MHIVLLTLLAILILGAIIQVSGNRAVNQYKKDLKGEKTKKPLLKNKLK